MARTCYHFRPQAQTFANQSAEWVVYYSHIFEAFLCGYCSTGFSFAREHEISVETSDNSFSSSSTGVWGIDWATLPVSAPCFHSFLSLPLTSHSQHQERLGGERAGSMSFLIYVSSYLFSVQSVYTHF